MSDQPDTERTAPEPEGQAVTRADQGPAACEQPPAVGRYRVERLLGEGGFGRVYLAHDEQLRRPVAVKVPHRRLVARPQDAEPYLAEARTAAGLDHPNIVPVFDVGSTAGFPCFIVSKFIEGCTLARKMRDTRPVPAEAARLMAAVAEALHHAHRKGVVHRDVKPGNILLDAVGRPYVADFGLALREEDAGRGPGYVGTPPYMSPEQARGEGHRVDGRSDIFSLAVVFYELLTGRHPFRASSRAELLQQIATAEPRPPRQVDDAIPRELERICLKALALRASERYTTAGDMAEDLRHFLAGQAADVPPPSRSRALSPLAAPPPSPPLGTSGYAPTVASTPSLARSDGLPLRVVPRGLRSFEAQDADFFLELVPGPRDRGGLPEGVRFWKAQVEETDADNTFAVGLIYGPSGCGKSSLVKAGLLPWLADHVLPVYVEAAAGRTEARLLAGLRKRCPALPADGGLAGALAALRRGQGLPAGAKVLLVLDQFEQWLHARAGGAEAELVQALRQCDGGRVQCLVLVRDDFWLAVSRFMRDLEIRLVEGQNCALADLFDLDHARKVLAAFGRAFGKLPEDARATTREQQAFLAQAVCALARDGKVICVRLALFAEMMKGRPWTPASLKAVGGAEGVGVTFLEETFSAPGAPPEHRYHQHAARAVLRALLPESGTDIKGRLCSDAELREASGYAGRPRDFEELVRILDGEVRLLTPAEPEGAPGEDRPGGEAGRRYYQLTHDYLVPSLRAWLTRKQRETRRGRAELCLAERAALWGARPENRFLPSGWEWLAIRLLTRPHDWTTAQRQMMRRAGRYYAARGLLLVAGLFVLLALGREGFGRLRAQGLRDRLLVAAPEDVPRVVHDMAPYRRWLRGPLRQTYAEAEAGHDARKQLHASLALLPDDPGQVEYLYGRLLTAGPPEFLVIREALRPYAGVLAERLWAVLQDRKRDPAARLRAACGLAADAPDDGRWEGVRDDVAVLLVPENVLLLARWADALRPVRRSLLPALAVLATEEGHDPEERRTIAGLYADYAEGLPDAFAPLERVLAERVGPGAGVEARLALARRQANAAVALAAAGRWDQVRPLLRSGPDPTRRSYLIDRLGPGGAEPRALTGLLAPEVETSVRRAALLALAEYDQDRLPLAEREELVPLLAGLYRDDPDPGLHAAAGWLLRRWGRPEKVTETDRALATGEAEGSRRWYVNRQGQTMVLVPPGEFWAGEGEGARKRRVERGFALAAREVTVAEFRRFRKDHSYAELFAPSEDCPVNGVSWFEAAAYCNWLSKKEDISEDQWCYLPNARGKYAPGMRVAPGFQGRSGYRLPTAAEWEYACRAGSRTPWCMGEAEDLLPKYAWCAVNSSGRSHPVGRLRPNDFGLFDLHGNVEEWCHDGSGERPADAEALVGIRDRILCGGAFPNLPFDVRAASRSERAPTEGVGLFGFRTARTYP
jgi:serine/threonine protein kinase/formylglycine-generating enzyme required for sulfatase activity